MVALHFRVLILGNKLFIRYKIYFQNSYFHQKWLIYFQKTFSKVIKSTFLIFYKSFSFINFGVIIK